MAAATPATDPSAHDYVVGIDLGGSNARGALTDITGETLADTSVRTTTGDAEAVLGQLAALSRRLPEAAAVDWSRVAAVAIGLPGVVNRHAGDLRLAPNLPPFADLDIASALHHELGVPVVLDNDVNLATLAEQRHGLGVGVEDFVFIAIGTGVGMGIVAGGQLQRGTRGAAGEIGLLSADAATGPSRLEELVSGIGVARRYAQLSGANETVDLFAHAAAGDAAAQAVLDDQAHALARAVMAVLVILDPALIVFGGGLGARPEVVDAVRALVLAQAGRAIRMQPSSLGERGGLIGATELARARAAGHVLGLPSSGGRAR